MLIIGIDPGINGAICFFKNGTIIELLDMPTMSVGKKNKSQVNGSQIFNEVQKVTLNENKKECQVRVLQACSISANHLEF